MHETSSLQGYIALHVTATVALSPIKFPLGGLQQHPSWGPAATLVKLKFTTKRVSGRELEVQSSLHMRRDPRRRYSCSEPSSLERPSPDRGDSLLRPT